MEKFGQIYYTILLILVNVLIAKGHGQIFGIKDEHGMETTSSDGWHGIDQGVPSSKATQSNLKIQSALDDFGNRSSVNSHSFGSGSFHPPNREPEVKVTPVFRIPRSRRVIESIHIPAAVKKQEPTEIPVPVVMEKIIKAGKIVKYKLEKPIPVKFLKKMPVPVSRSFTIPVYKTKYIH